MTPRIPLVLLLAIGLLVPTAVLGQTGDVDVTVEATSDGEPLESVAPDQVIRVFANATVPNEEDTEYRAFLNVTLDGEDRAQDGPNIDQDGQIETNVGLRAPSEEGEHTLGWTVTVQSQSSTESTWTTEHVEEDGTSFTVERPDPPNPEDVSVDVEPVAGGTTLGEATAGEQILLFANVTVPEREQTAWRATLNATLDGEKVGDATQQRTGEGSMELLTTFTAPQQEGDYELSWNVSVDYQDTGTASDWENVVVEEDTQSFTVAPPTAPPAPGIPWLWIFIIGAVLAGGGGVAYWWTRRDRQIRGQARSQAMRDLEGESFEQPAESEPEVHPQLKILEARAEDLRRMIDLAQERYDDGDLTQHQYETIRERKEEELEEVQAKMDEYREA